MITEDYVSFETAKLLKDKGFDEPCECFYDTEHNDISIVNEWMDTSNSQLEEREFLCYSAPTLQMAMKWLREAHYLTIDVFHFRDWKVNIKTIPDDYFTADYSYPELKPAKTYEQACESAIKYCLENLI